ncbi:unnamed protein product [Toxocara canis]|uniref:Uncharacterized protein n=1 Tax=Toxocara canis TaxID=6265 RepID=A0A183U854_TOXCA|nr:unnamed protein product [Toxocara canis]
MKKIEIIVESTPEVELESMKQKQIRRENSVERQVVSDSLQGSDGSSAEGTLADNGRSNSTMAEDAMSMINCTYASQTQRRSQLQLVTAVKFGLQVKHLHS